MLPLDEAAREYKVNAGSGVASPGGGVEVQASWPQCKPSFHNKSTGTNRGGGDRLETATTGGSILCLQNKIGV